MSAIAEIQIEDEYKPEYSNTSSSAYEEFVGNFIHQVIYEHCIHHDSTFPLVQVIFIVYTLVFTALIMY